VLATKKIETGERALESVRGRTYENAAAAGSGSGFSVFAGVKVERAEWIEQLDRQPTRPTPDSGSKPALSMPTD